MSLHSAVLLERARALVERGEHDLALELLVVVLDDAAGDPEVLSEVDSLRQRIVRASEQREAMRRRESKPPSRSPAKVATESREDYVMVSAPETLPPGARIIELPKRKTHSRRSVVAAWAFLLTAIVTSAAMILAPERLDYLLNYHQLSDPYETARGLLEQGKMDEAIAEAERLVEAGDRVGEALLLIADVEAGRGDLEAENRVLRRAVLHPQSDWQVNLTAALRLRGAGEVSAAAQAYTNAFHRGAPAQRWLEIAQAFHDLERADPAISLYRTILRSYEPGADSARAALEALGVLE